MFPELVGNLPVSSKYKDHTSLFLPDALDNERPSQTKALIAQETLFSGYVEALRPRSSSTYGLPDLTDCIEQ